MRAVLGIVVPLAVAYVIGGWFNDIGAPRWLCAVAGVLLAVAWIHTFRPFRARR